MTTVKDRNAYQLASLVGCASPDTLDSPGARFLLRVQDSARELVEGAEPGEDLTDAIHERADAAVPIYTHEMWATFVDLGAYEEVVTEYGPIEDMGQAAQVALYMIAERLLSTLVEEARTDYMIAERLLSTLAEKARTADD